MTTVIVQLRARQTAKAPKICFIHVPKCGGAAVSRAIAQSYSYWNRLIVPNWYINLRASRVAADLTGCVMTDLRESVLIYKLAEARAKFVTGHIICRPRTRETFEKQWHFVTVLRDPVTRWISEFVYNTYGKQEWARNTLPIEEYVASPVGVASAARYIEYFSTWRPDEPIRDHHVESAVANLSCFTSVGVLEDLPTFASSLEGIVDRQVRIPKVNVSPRREVVAQIMDRTDLLERVRSLCGSDIAVYEQVAAARRRQIQDCQRPPEGVEAPAG